MENIATRSDAIYITLNSSSSVFWTIISGVIIFVLGQLFIETVLKPYMRFKQLKSKISYSLILYAKFYSNPLSTKEYWGNGVLENHKIEYKEASEKLRKLASELTGFTEEKWRINIYLPQNKNIAKAARNLIGLSNNMVISETHKDVAVEHNLTRVEEIKNALKILNDVEL